ncbi:MAG: 16S rRNA (cytosine(1402)-N(4))-methyltransferase RsmH [Pseudomonadota bacterium]
MSAAAPHIPVLLDPILTHCAPIAGTWVDGTFGAGGYTRALLEAGADRVIAIDRDPAVFALAASWAPALGDRLTLVEATFSDLDAHAEGVDGVVLDLGVSSMQIDEAARGFSFMKDGPLDMRMGQAGRSAADIVAEASEGALADILFHYGEERASRRIARAIVRAREAAPILSTLRLAEIIEGALPRPKPGQSHPATRSFQALRIAVNAEYDELFAGLMAAERALRPGGLLAVVSFHSVEDRIVKRFLQLRGGKAPAGSRYAPEVAHPAAPFALVTRKAVEPTAAEVAANPRARSAKLRIARRTDENAPPPEPASLGLPQLPETRR